MSVANFLLVDDDDRSRAALAAQLLRAIECDVVEAATHDQARTLLVARPFDAMILSLPEHQAPAEVAALLAEAEAVQPVIVVSEDRSLEVVQALLAHGAWDVLLSPVMPQRLSNALARAVRWARVWRERETLLLQTARQAQEFNALYTVGRNVSALLKLEDILNLVVNAAVNLIRADEGLLMLLDPSSGELHLRASRSLSASAAQLKRVPVNDTLMGRVIQTGRPVMLGGGDLLKVKTSFLVKSILGVPLLEGQRAFGVLSVYNIRNPRLFTEHDVHLLSTLADAAAIAIQNAQLYEQTQRHAELLSALVEIERRISESLDLTTVLERIAQSARDVLHTADSEVYLLAEDGETLRAIVAVGDYAEEIKAESLRVGRGIVGYVAKSGVAEMVNEVEHDPRKQDIPGTPDEHEALLCAPLMLRGQLLGVMAVARVGDEPPFEYTDFEFFKGLAAQAAVAIENARLYGSERRRAIELARSLEKQSELDKLKSEFVQNVSHELRTPLAIIRGYAELLKDGELGQLTDEQMNGINVIARRSIILSKMLDDLLVILSAETGKMDHTPVDMVSLTRTTLIDFDVQAKQAKLNLSSRIQMPLAPIYGDAAHLRRVLDNLLGNALKFTPAGGEVSLALYDLDSNVILEVSDTGAGIAPEHLDRIFERFYQVDGSTTRRHAGVGLGLALVKEIAVAHGGNVEVASTMDKGTTFRVSLPMMQSPPASDTL